MITHHLGPSGQRPFRVPSPHIYVVCSVPFLDSNNPLWRLTVTSGDDGQTVSGCIKGWQDAIIEGCSPASSDYDRAVFNQLYQDFSDLGLEFNKRKIQQVTGFTLQ